jgi:predicted amidohydrolase
MKPKPFKLALIQMLVKGGDKDWNISHACELISEAALNGAQVALLPECMDLGWTHPSCLTMAEEIPDGQACRALRRAAGQNAMYVCSGLTEKSGDRIYNSAVIINKNGEVLCRHRKLHELDIGHEFYAQGDRLNVAETEFCTFGLMICADGLARDNVLLRSLCYMGADVILSPSAWARESDHDNAKDPYGGMWRDSYIPVAKQFAVTIVGLSNVGPVTDGPWKGRKCIGCSLAIGPSGEEILQGPYGIDAECILYVDIQPVPRPARGEGWNAIFEQSVSKQNAANDAAKGGRK